MSLKKDIQNRFHDFIHAIAGGAIDFFEALASAIENSGGQLLRDAALAAVQAAEANGGSGDDKFKAAYESVVDTLTKQGIPIAVNAIEGAIIAAVAKIKA